MTTRLTLKSFHQEIFSLREAQGDPDALQKLVEKGQEQIRALRDRLSQNEKKLADMGSSIKHKDAELASVKGVLMRRAEKSGESKQQVCVCIMCTYMYVHEYSCIHIA